MAALGGLGVDVSESWVGVPPRRGQVGSEAPVVPAVTSGCVSFKDLVSLQTGTREVGLRRTSLLQPSDLSGLLPLTGVWRPLSPAIPMSQTLI